MSAPAPRWRRYEACRPDELADLVARFPVACWPLGLLEHHGWHLPVGYDGLKAERICQRLAGRTGGLLLPVMWWGGGGGHDRFRWTHYQPAEATAAILETTVHQLFDSGFRVVVLLAGHYPWQPVLDASVPELSRVHADGLILAGTEVTIGGDLGLRGDHAALEETSYGLALFPELVDLDALRGGRQERDAWPAAGPPPADRRHPRVSFDADDPLFGQLGADARQARAGRGEAGLQRLVDHLADRIDAFLSGS